MLKNNATGSLSTSAFMAVTHAISTKQKMQSNAKLANLAMSHIQLLMEPPIVQERLRLPTAIKQLIARLQLEQIALRILQLQTSISLLLTWLQTLSFIQRTIKEK